VVTVDETKLDRGIERLAGRVDRPARDGDVRFARQGRVERLEPRQGRTVDVDATRAAILDAYPLATGTPVGAPVVTVDPAVSAAEVSRAMREFGNPAVSAPVVLRIAGERIVLEPAQYAAALSMEPVQGRLEPRLDEKRLLAVLRPAMRSVAVAPKDATVQIVDGRPRVVPGRTGVTFDPQAITSTFLRLVVASGKDRELRLETEVAHPELSAADMRELGITEVVSSFTTYFPHAEYRNVNIGRAAQLINGTVLQPGDTFSLNGVVGERTAENGFTRGFIISDGVFRQDYGGGVSQVATTMFNAAFFAGLQDVEHKPHSFYISRYPVGREATVAWPSLDLKFKNDTPHGILIQAWRDPSTPSTQGAMNVRMWSTKVWDIKAGQSERYNFTSHQVRHLGGPDCEPNSGYGGFDIDVYRSFYRPGSDRLVKRETFHTTYTPSDTVICDG
jgi:vancomycin resistance protein YoaR